MKKKMMCLIAALSIFTLPADAAQIVNRSTPITVSVPVVCNVGEVVDLSGRLQTVITFMRNSRRGSVHVLVNGQGVAGIGEITGRTFQANGEWDVVLNRSLLNGAGTVGTKVWFWSPVPPDPTVVSPALGFKRTYTLRSTPTVP